MPSRLQRIINYIRRWFLYKAKEMFIRLKVFFFPNKKLRKKEFMHVRIRVFHALNQDIIAKAYTLKQQEVLKEFGVEGVSSAKQNIADNANAYFFLVENAKTGEIGAGMRLEVADSISQLPLEVALKDLAKDLPQRIHRFDNIIAEACGWWTDSSYSERRLPKHLLASAVAVAPKLRIKVMLGFPHTITKKITDSLGFTNVRNLGDGGSFLYPNDKYVSTVVELDTITLNTMAEEEREKIITLRENPVQTFIISTKEGYFTRIDFDLRLL